MADGVQLADTDLWMHIRFGQIVLNTGHILRHDIFSYSAPGAPWVNHEWLSDVLIASCYNAYGVVGLKLMKFVGALAVVVLIAEGLAETGAGPGTQIATLFGVAIAIMPQVQFRPQIFDYIFLAAMLLILGRYLRGRSAALWLIIPIMALWANLHGGFFVGIAVMAVYTAATGLQDLAAGRGIRRSARLAALTFVALLATLLNPFGIREWIVVLSKFKEPLIAMNANVEFESLPYHLTAAGGLKFLGTISIAMLLVIGGVSSVLISPMAEDLPLVAIAVMMTCGWAYAVRNMAFAVIAWAAPLARHMSLALDSRGTGRSGTGDFRRVPMHTHLLIAAAASAIAVSSGDFTPLLPTYAPYPSGAIAFMERHHLRGNIFAEYEWGEYVIWHEAPASRVFFDGFDERYPAKVQKGYIDFAIKGGDRAAAVLKGYPHDYVLLATDSSAARFMATRRDWILLYRDPVSSLFARANSSAAAIPGLPELHGKAPSSMFP